MDIITTSTKMSEYISGLRKKNHKISFIPTMGGLHEGHISLITRSKKEKTKKIVSIFVNPLQFNKKSDYDNYPITIEKDLEKLIEHNIDCLFLPSKEILNEVKQHKLHEKLYLLDCLCAKYRPNHFEGVYAIICTLFNLINPDYVYFGDKDYQQTLLIEYMIEKLYNNKIILIRCETIRDKLGLAVSSRNTRLSEQEKKDASNMYKELEIIRKKILNNFHLFDDLKKETIKNLKKFNLDVEYLELLTLDKLKKSEGGNNNLMLFIAAVISDVRLIDNIKI